MFINKEQIEKAMNLITDDIENALEQNKIGKFNIKSAKFKCIDSVNSKTCFVYEVEFYKDCEIMYVRMYYKNDILRAFL